MHISFRSLHSSCTCSASWFSYFHYVFFSHFSFLSSSFVYMLCTHFLILFFPFVLGFPFVLAMKIMCCPILYSSFSINMWLNLKSFMTVQHLGNPVSIFSVLSCKFWLMKPGWKIQTICKGSCGQTMNLCPNWETPCLYLSLLLYVFKLNPTSRNKEGGKSKLEVLHDSLKEHPLCS